MIIDLINYKIRIIRPNNGKLSQISINYPLDIPGRVIAVDIMDKVLLSKYVNKHRLLEVICNSSGSKYGRADLRVRWDNNHTGWCDINSRFLLLSSCYPQCKSIWNSNQSSIARDFRPAHERRPRTISKLPYSKPRGFSHFVSTKAKYNTTYEIRSNIINPCQEVNTVEPQRSNYSVRDEWFNSETTKEYLSFDMNNLEDRVISHNLNGTITEIETPRRDLIDLNDWGTVSTTWESTGSQ